LDLPSYQNWGDPINRDEGKFPACHCVRFDFAVEPLGWEVLPSNHVQSLVYRFLGVVGQPESYGCQFIFFRFLSEEVSEETSEVHKKFFFQKQKFSELQETKQ